MGWLTTFLNKIRIPDYSDYDYDEEINWKSFVLDESIWNSDVVKVPVHYVRQLHTVIDQMREECAELLLLDVEQMKERYNALWHDHKEAKTQLAVATMEVMKYRMWLELSETNQSATGKRNVRREAAGLTPLDDPDQPREGNKFASIDGLSKIEKQKIAACMYEYGVSLPDIARHLNLSSGSVKNYISDINKHYNVLTIDGRSKIVTFDGETGGDKWDLDEVFGDMVFDSSEDREEDEIEGSQPEPATLPYQRGIIRKYLKNPVING